MTQTPPKEPWQMSLAEFLVSKPKVTRCFRPYEAGQWGSRWASTTLGHRQRQAAGEFYYINGTDGFAYPTAKAAKIGLHRALIIKAWKDGFVVPQEATAGHYGLRESLLTA